MTASNISTAHRPSFERIYMDLAKTLANRSTCKRLHVGTVITSTDYRKVLAIMFYQSEEEMLAAFAAGDIESIHSVSAEELSRIKRDGTQTIHTPLPRIFGVFFNQTNAPVFANTEVKTALAMVTDREQIVQSVFSGYAQPIHEPLPLSIVGLATEGERYPATTASASSTREQTVFQARELLRKNGWKPNAQGIMEKTVKKETYTLQFTISTSNAPDLVKTAELVKKQWEEIGAKVETKYYELADLNQLVIKPRKYDALLFGEIIGRDLDLFAFWHSSQRNDPGLNIALYTSSKADKMLETARTATNQEERLKQFKLFNEEVTKDVPAIFLYAPEFIYILPDTIQNFNLNAMSSPSDRFSNVHKWYTTTENVWNIPAFTKDRVDQNNNQ
jgi:peptide/nickel transport system substrate-binding protein